MGQKKSSNLSPLWGRRRGPLIRYMKKNYISPLAVEVNVAAENMIATSLKISDKTVDTSAEGGQLGGNRRGEWGNLWQ